MSPQFLVTDIEHSIEFYKKKLGFEVEFSAMKISTQVLSKMATLFIIKSGKPSTEERKRKRETLISILSFQ
jgi:catechol 2,3-dioxygenase-like lactoylglutathione lyase family enzyme